MKNLYKHFLFSMLFSTLTIGFVNAQTQGDGTPISGSSLINTTIDFNVYNALSSSTIWEAGCGSASINAYGGSDTESWMISQSQIDFSSVSNAALVVTENIGYFTTLDDVKVLYSTDYSGSGDPSSATWTDFNYDNSLNGDRTGGALVAIFDGVTSSAYIAFKYTGLTSGGNVCSWTISTVEVKDKTTLSAGSALPTSLVNGDFEGTWCDDNSPIGWTKAENITKESTIVHSGTYSAKQVGGTKDITQFIAVEEGKTYEISFWYYIESGDGTDGRLWSFFEKADGSDTGEIKDPNDYLNGTTGQWNQYKKEYTAPALTTQINFELRTYSGAVVYWDDITITDVTNLANTEVNLLDVSVYPNPVKENLNITLGEKASNINVNIFNLNGQKVYSNAFDYSNQLSIPVENLSKGMYVLKVNGDNKTSNIKFIKE